MKVGACILLTSNLHELKHSIRYYRYAFKIVHYLKDLISCVVLVFNHKLTHLEILTCLFRIDSAFWYSSFTLVALMWKLISWLSVLLPHSSLSLIYTISIAPTPFELTYLFVVYSHFLFIFSISSNKSYYLIKKNQYIGNLKYQLILNLRWWTFDD